jgi:PIN domain nuclease of toxin-antitoxin system
VILLDTHIWIWWVQGSEGLTAAQQRVMEESEADGLGVSVISCWEVAKLTEAGRHQLPISTLEWLDTALAYPGVRLVELTPRVAVESTQLPGTFHRDPADQIIVATARVHECALLTADRKLLDYPHVQTF